MKHCGRCGVVKQLGEFNKDKYTKSGYRSQCKDCMTKERIELKDYYKQWREDEDRKKWYANYRKSRYQEGKIKVKARNAARSLVRQPCEVCGTTERIHAHHDDYAFPLDVRWLCAAHHSQWHKKNGEGKNPF